METPLRPISLARKNWGASVNVSGIKNTLTREYNNNVSGLRGNNQKHRYYAN